MSAAAATAFERARPRPRVGAVAASLLCAVLWAAFLASHGAARAVLLVAPAAAVTLLALQPTAVLRNRKLPLPLLLFGLWCLASAAWTRSSVGTQDALLDLVAALAGGWCLGALVRLPELLRWSSIAIRGLLVVSVATLVVAPAWATRPAVDGAPGWHAVFTHKNGLGGFTVLALVTLWHDTHRPHRGAWIGLALVLMVGSRSSTALALVLVLGAALLWRRSLGGLRTTLARTGYVTLSTLLAAGAAAVFLTRFDLLTSFLGRGSDLSGRTGIWTSVWRAGAGHRLVGHGFGGAWVEPVTPTSTIWKELRFEAFHAHSGYLDLLLQVGLIGLTLFLGAIVVTVVRAVRHGGPSGSWVATTLLVLCLNAVAESGPFLGIGLVLVSLFATATLQHPAGRTPSMATATG